MSRKVGPEVHAEFSERDAIEALEQYKLSDQDGQLCVACGHWGLRHGEDGCQAGKNGLPFQDNGYPSRSRVELIKRDDVCWCPKFTNNPTEAIQLILDFGNAEALRSQLANNVQQRNGPAIASTLRFYVARTTANERDAALIEQANQLIASGDPHNPPEKDRPRNFSASEDYRTIRFNDHEYSLTRNQAIIVKRLHEARQQGTPALGKDVLLEAIGCETSRVRDSFKGSVLWNKLIVHGERRGTYRLNLKS